VHRFGPRPCLSLFMWCWARPSIGVAARLSNAGPKASQPQFIIGPFPACYPRVIFSTRARLKIPPWLNCQVPRHHWELGMGRRPHSRPPGCASTQPLTTRALSTFVNHNTIAVRVPFWSLHSSFLYRSTIGTGIFITKNTPSTLTTSNP